jgi:hypothetical protein
MEAGSGQISRPHGIHNNWLAGKRALNAHFGKICTLCLPTDYHFQFETVDMVVVRLRELQELGTLDRPWRDLNGQRP